MIMAMVDGIEISVDPLDANTWHTPKNQREYLRSPQRAQWRTAKEKKMDQYQQLKVFKLVPRAGLDPKRIMGSLWAFKIKFNELGKFDKLNPRWCVKGYGMDKSIYVGFSEVCLTTSIKILACIRAAYPVKDYSFDCGNAFQATRTDHHTGGAQFSTGNLSVPFHMAHPGGGRELPMKLAVPPFDARDRSVLAALPFRVLFRCRRII